MSFPYLTIPHLAGFLFKAIEVGWYPLKRALVSLSRFCVISFQGLFVWEKAKERG